MAKIWDVRGWGIGCAAGSRPSPRRRRCAGPAGVGWGGEGLTHMFTEFTKFQSRRAGHGWVRRAGRFTAFPSVSALRWACGVWGGVECYVVG